MSSKNHYLTLDFLRGIAAIAVLFVHFFAYQKTSYFGSGYLAVDFFFLLSGFVIACSYEARLLSAMPVWRFMLLRIIRLYPLIVVGVMIELGRRLMGVAFLHGETLDPAFLFAAVTNALMVPIPFHVGLGEEVYPLDPPLWSLFFELVVNMAYAIWLVRLRNAPLFLIILVSAITLIALNAAGLPAAGVGGGAEVANFLSGVPRVTLSFSLGVLVFRLRSAGRLPSWSAGPLILSTLLLVVLAPPRLFWTPLGELDIAVIVFPAMVMLGANHQPGHLISKVSRTFGDLSYPLYVLHVPLLGLLLRALYWEHLLPHHASVLLTMGGTAFVCFMAAIILRVYDEPVREWLARMLLSRTHPAALTGRRAEQMSAETRLGSN